MVVFYLYYFSCFAVIKIVLGPLEILRKKYWLVASFLAVFLLGSTVSFAQQNRKAADSAIKARQAKIDSARIARQKVTDSLKASRKRVTDSMAAVRKYRESKRYQDSVLKSRQARLDSVRNIQKAKVDSMQAARKKITDSATAVRKKITDSTRAVTKKRTDSMAAVRKYRESKRFKDSVAINRQMRLDSMRLVRKKIADSSIAARKKVLDSAKASRKRITDSTLAARKVFSDSVKAVRQVKADSIAAVRAEKERLKKVKEKDREKKMQLAVELKIQKKRKKFTNETMLKKKWGLPRQIVQNTFTRYNYYFNADRKMDEALDNMQRMSRESYDSTLALFPFDPDRDSASLASDMDSIIQKASVGIQIHDPRTKWGDDLYLLLGQSYYYKGDYTNASASFRYIVSLRELDKKRKAQNTVRNSKGKKELSIVDAEKKTALDFIKHKPVHNEALLWLARTYTEAHKEDEAESVLELVGTDPNFPESLKPRLALEKAYLALSRRDYREANTNLWVVASDPGMPDWLRRRAAYLNGQLLQDQGRYNEAAERFRKVVDLKPAIEMDFHARKQVAYSLMLAGGEQKDAVASLKSMLNDGKYATYYEQVYYVLGKLAANSNNTNDALTYLDKSINSPKSTKKQKALSYAALGDVHYGAGNYEGAKMAYDSAAALARYAAGDKGMQLAVRRSQVLDAVTIPARIIRTQDSLLVLAGMNERDQRAVVRKYIRMLEQARADSIYKAENAGVNAAQQNDAEQNADPNANTGGVWYFANSTLMRQGLNEFKRKWGNRANADNWRRISAGGNTNTNQPGAVAAGNEEETGGNLTLDENGLPTEESLLALIPKTAEDQKKARELIQKAYMDLGNGYIRELEDYPHALSALDTLSARFPAHPYKDEELYNRYVIAMRQNKLPQAQGYTQELLQKFPDSRFAVLVRPSESGDGLLAANTTGISVANYYDETYNLMMQHQYEEALMRSREGQRQYNDPQYISRFRIMEAISLAGSGRYSQADTLINAFLMANPPDSLKSWAESVRQFVLKNKPPDPPAPGADSLGAKAPVPGAPGTAGNATGNTNANTGNTTSSAPASAAPEGTFATVPVPTDAPEQYTYKPTEEHYFVFAFPKMEQKAMGVKAGLTDFNSMKFTGQNLKSTIDMLNAQQGLLVTRSFKSSAQARIYMNVFRQTQQLTREYKPGDYDVFIISANNYKKLLKDRSVPAYLNFYKANYK